MISTDKEYVKIRIDGILNLEDISRSYEMTSKELMEFHNKHCALHELLTLTLPKYIEHLYIPERAFKKQESNQLKSTKLDLPNTESTKVYGVIVKFFPKELQLHYKINVKRIQNTIELVKEKTYINNQEITKVVEQIFEKAEQALYPLKIITDHNGDLLKIDNSEQIAERWSSKYLPELKEYYVSESAEEIIDELDKALKDVDAKRNMLTKNIFYRLFCLPVYQSYPEFLKKDILHICFPGMPGEVSYKVEYKLGKNYTRGNKIVLEIKGVEEESMINLNAQKGHIELFYKLHKETKILFSITGVISAFDHDIEQKIEFQLYELNS